MPASSSTTRMVARGAGGSGAGGGGSTVSITGSAATHGLDSKPGENARNRDGAAPLAHDAVRAGERSGQVVPGFLAGQRAFEHGGFRLGIQRLRWRDHRDQGISSGLQRSARPAQILSDFQTRSLERNSLAGVHALAPALDDGGDDVLQLLGVGANAIR